MGDVSYQGKWYAFPVDFKTWGVYYNKDIFAELGLEVPSTQTELLEICQKLKDAGYDPWAQWYADGASVDIEMRPVVWTEAIQNGDNDMFEKLMSGEKKVADYPYFATGRAMTPPPTSSPTPTRSSCPVRPVCCIRAHGTTVLWRA